MSERDRFDETATTIVRMHDRAPKQWLEVEIAAAIRKAVAAEKERCAGVAENARREMVRDDCSGGYACDYVAAEIRKGEL